MKYQAEVTEISEMALKFLEMDMLIIFNNNAPQELAEISVLHSIEEMEREVEVGDTVRFGESTYAVTAVGDEANHTLKLLGHCSFKFSGKPQADLPGQIELKGSALPIIKVGDQIQILKV
jgi:PTS system glucitol/sorbitol-specific IIA component